jgi:7-cyano-7-deazaguanine synthase
VAGDLVLFSGGLDSTVCLATARREAVAHFKPPPVALTFDYHQRHRRELVRARNICEHLGIEQLMVEIDASAWGGSALTDKAIPVPEASTPDTIPPTYVPARNLIFLAVATSVAEARDLDRVQIGVNALDYSGYPDCRPEFIDAFRNAARLGTRRGIAGRPIEVVAPLVGMTKAEIVRQGLDLDAPLGFTWSCYRGLDRPCGTCDSCTLRAKGFAEAGAIDPALMR